MALSKCNCENTACDHGERGCSRTALGNKRLLYVGSVCLECWNKMDPKYRITEGR